MKIRLLLLILMVAVQAASHAASNTGDFKMVMPFTVTANGKEYVFNMTDDFFAHNPSWNGEGPVPFELSKAIYRARVGMNKIYQPKGHWIVYEAQLKSFGLIDKSHWAYMIIFGLDPHSAKLNNWPQPLTMIVSLKGDLLKPSQIKKAVALN